jgi:2-dehydropantoate 2-reductase
MQVLVVGAGVIGSIYGWALAQNGHRVVHFVRSGRAAALCDGFALDIFDRRKGHQLNLRGQYNLVAVETLSPSDSFDLIIVPVKHNVLARTLVEIVPRAGDAEFLLLTQNWRATKEIDSILPRARYVFGDAKAGGKFSKGTLFAALRALDLGPPEGEPSELTRRVAALFSTAQIRTRLHSDMLHYLWVQYAMTGGPWARLVKAGSLDELFKDHEAILEMLCAGRECLQVVRERGVELSRYPETKPYLTNSVLLRQFYIWMIPRMFRDQYQKRCSAHALDDPDEVKTFYDDLIGTGRDLGVSMPVMESCAEDIRRFAMNLQTR